MAHEIRDNDKVLLARTQAWHGLGTVLPDTFTPEEALTIGGLGWTVEESTALTATFAEADGSATRNIVETHKVLRRSDDKSVLATVGINYGVVQNSTLIDIANTFSLAGNVRCETAGSLFGGRRVFVLLDGKTVDVGGRGDLVNRFIMLHNGHDGMSALGADIVTTRVVCNNTFMGALREGGAFFRFRHTSGIGLRIEDAKQALAGYAKQAQEDDAIMAALAAKPMNREQIQALWTDVLVALDGPIAANPSNEKQQRRRDKAVSELASMSRVFDAEAAQYGASAWVAANAVTNVIEHQRGRMKGDARMSANLFGAYADAKRVAMNAAVALL